MHWIAGIAYILQKIFPSLQNLSLEELVINNFLLNIMFGQILLAAFISEVNLIFNHVYALYLWYTLPPLPPRPAPAEPHNEDANNDVNNYLMFISDVNGNFR